MTKSDKFFLDSLISKFLAERIGDGEGWPPVTPEIGGQLWDIINCLIRLKEQPDCDGDHGLQAMVWSRPRNDPFHFDPVPNPRSDFKGYVRATETNFRIASEEMARVVRKLIED
jgi:hypothetical protein